MIQFVAGALLAAIVSLLAYRGRTLTRGGAVAAFAVGAVVFGAGGWPGAAVLFAFFLSSVLLSRIGRARKHALIDAGKQGARDAWQVLANGGVAAACLLGAAALRAPLLLAAFAGAFAAAAADTWGTEIGTLAPGPPRSILTLRPIPAGLSGGITLAGSLATLGGAAVVALVAAFAHVAPFAPVALAGVAGALLDSILGASVQALRRCPACACDCETNPHRCGSATVLRRGYAWMENDAINLAATLGGALAGAIALAAGLGT